MPPVTSLEELEAIYGRPAETATVKEVDRIIPHYRAFIEASPFAILATAGPEGLDCSPRGDRPGFVAVRDEYTLLLPDRRGNNRVDSLRNVVRDPRVALLFLIPGSGNSLRVNGTALIDADPALCEGLAIDGKPPRTVLVLTVQSIYFQCARAIVRSALWDPASQVAPESLPSAGEILAELSGGRVGGPDYDRDWPDRAKSSLW